MSPKPIRCYIGFEEGEVWLQVVGGNEPIESRYPSNDPQVEVDADLWRRYLVAQDEWIEVQTLLEETFIKELRTIEAWRMTNPLREKDELKPR